MNSSKGRDTRRDKSLRHVTATGCCNKSPRVTCENHCRCDRIFSLRSVAQIQTGLNLCDISQRQTKRKRLVAAAVQTRRLVAAICRIVCLGLNLITGSDAQKREHLPGKDQSTCSRGARKFSFFPEHPSNSRHFIPKGVLCS